MALSPAEAAYQLAHANQSEVGQLIGSTAVLTALATLLVTARFISRVYTKVGLRADDWAILIALILSWASFVTNVYGKPTKLGNVFAIIPSTNGHVAARNGLGRHLITVTPVQSIGLEKVRYDSCHSIRQKELLIHASLCIESLRQRPSVSYHHMRNPALVSPLLRSHFHTTKSAIPYCALHLRRARDRCLPLASTSDNLAMYPSGFCVGQDYRRRQMYQCACHVDCAGYSLASRGRICSCTATPAYLAPTNYQGREDRSQCDVSARRIVSIHPLLLSGQGND